MTDHKRAVRTDGQTESKRRDMARQPDESEIYLTLHRTINAPVETVYAAWTEPELLRQWFAPDDAVVARVVAEVMIGGRFLVEMHGTDGGKWITCGRYREVAPNRRLVHTWCWDGSDAESLVTAEFEPGSAGTTRVTLTHSRFVLAEARDSHRVGWLSCLAKLEAMYPED